MDELIYCDICHHVDTVENLTPALRLRRVFFWWTRPDRVWLCRWNPYCVFSDESLRNYLLVSELR